MPRKKSWNCPSWRPLRCSQSGHCVQVTLLFLVLSQILQALPRGDWWSHRPEYPNTSALKEAWSPPSPNIQLGLGCYFSAFFFISHLCCSSLGCVTDFFVPMSCRSVGCLRLVVPRFLGSFTWDINSVYHQQANFWPWVFGCLLDTSSL